MWDHENEELLVWSVTPWATQRVKGISALVVILISIYGSFLWGGPVLGFLAVLILVGGMGSFFVKTEYRLTPESVSVRSPFQRVSRPWSGFRRAYVGAQGVSLSPFKGRHILEPYRSVVLRFGSHQEEVLAWVERYGPEMTGRVPDADSHEQ